MLIFLIIFVLFGANKIPQLGTGIGEGIRNFQKAMKGDKADDDKDKKEASESKTPKV